MNSAAPSPFLPVDERTLLGRLGELLDREEVLLATRDASSLVGLAEERERVTTRLAEAARTRRLTASAEDPELVELYVQLRQRHEVRAQVLKRHAQRNSQAIGVLAQATGRHDLYSADGRIRLQFAAA